MLFALACAIMGGALFLAVSWSLGLHDDQTTLSRGRMLPHNPRPSAVSLPRIPIPQDRPMVFGHCTEDAALPSVVVRRSSWRPQVPSPLTQQ